MVLPTKEDDSRCVRHRAVMGDRVWTIASAGAPKTRAWGCTDILHPLWILDVALCIGSEIVGKKLLAKITQYSCPADKVLQ